MARRTGLPAVSATRDKPGPTHCLEYSMGKTQPSMKPSRSAPRPFNLDSSQRALSSLGSLHCSAQVPNAIFANRYDDPIDCERCIQTVTPIAKHLGLKINSTYGYPPWIGGNSKAAAAMKEQLAVSFNILTAWEHNNIKYLSEDLGVAKSQIPDWPSTDFDSVYVLTFNDSMSLSSFHVAHENVTTGLLQSTNRSVNLVGKQSRA